MELRSDVADPRIHARNSIFALLSVLELDGGPVPSGRLLRKRAVREQIWYEVLTKLPTDGMLSSDSSR